MDLHGAVGNAERRLRAEQLAHRGLGARIDAGVDGAGRLHHQCARGHPFGGHVGQHVLYGLELGNAAAELLAPQRIVARIAQRHLGQAQHGRAVQQAVDGDAAQRQGQAPARLADQLGSGHAAAVEHDVARARLTGHGLVAADHLHARCMQVHEEGADLALRAALGRGRGHEHGEVGKRRARDEALAAVQHVVVALQHGARLQRARVRAGRCLGQRKADGFLGARHGQDELLHLQRRGLADQRAYARRAAEFAQHMGREGRSRGVDGLLDQHLVEHGQAGAAHGLGQGHAVEAARMRQLPDLAQQFGGGAVFMVHAMRAGEVGQFAVDEGVERVDQAGCALGAFKGHFQQGSVGGGECVFGVHLSSPCGRGWPSRAPARRGA